MTRGIVIILAIWTTLLVTFIMLHFFIGNAITFIGVAIGTTIQVIILVIAERQKVGKGGDF